MPTYLQDVMSPLAYEVLTYLLLAALLHWLYTRVLGGIDLIRRAVQSQSALRHAVNPTQPQSGLVTATHRMGAFGDLYQVKDWRDGQEPSYRYVRPATRDEARAHLAAYAIDGAGVFAVVSQGEDTSVLTPDSAGWQRLLVHGHNRHIGYFVVKGLPEDVDLSDANANTTVVPAGWAAVTA